MYVICNSLITCLSFDEDRVHNLSQKKKIGFIRIFLIRNIRSLLDFFSKKKDILRLHY